MTRITKEAIEAARASSPGKDGGQEVEEPCPTCGNEERGQGGYLSCECPATKGGQEVEAVGEAAELARLRAIALDMQAGYVVQRNHNRLRPVFPDPRIEKAIIARQQAELWCAVAIGSAIFVLLLWILPS